jgi:Ca2+-binding EF-hand superfamily protein
MSLRPASNFFLLALSTQLTYASARGLRGSSLLQSSVENSKLNNLQVEPSLTASIERWQSEDDLPGIDIPIYDGTAEEVDSDEAEESDAVGDSDSEDEDHNELEESEPSQDDDAEEGEDDEDDANDENEADDDEQDQDQEGIEPESAEFTLDPSQHEDHVRHLQRVGELADVNNDGLLSHDELLSFAERLRHKKRWEHTQQSLGQFDSNGDGLVGHDELGNSFETGAEGHRFRAADFDGDGKLNETEAYHFYHPEMHRSVLQVEAEHQFSRFDLDKDGFISFSEYKREDEQEESFDLESAWEDFSVHDGDGSQDLNMEEFVQLLSGQGLLSSNIAKTITAGDIDGDGHIHIHEEVPSALTSLLSTEFIEDFFYHASLHAEL